MIISRSLDPVIIRLNRPVCKLIITVSLRPFRAPGYRRGRHASGRVRPACAIGNTRILGPLTADRNTDRAAPCDQNETACTPRRSTASRSACLPCCISPRLPGACNAITPRSDTASQGPRALSWSSCYESSLSSKLAKSERHCEGDNAIRHGPPPSTPSKAAAPQTRSQSPTVETPASHGRESTHPPESRRPAPRH